MYQISKSKVISSTVIVWTHKQTRPTALSGPLEQSVKNSSCHMTIYFITYRSKLSFIDIRICYLVIMKADMSSAVLASTTKILVVDVRDEHGLVFTVCNNNTTHEIHGLNDTVMTTITAVSSNEM